MARVVAELGRPETPQETADRKAEFSRRYRSSKTFPSLIAAILATVGIMLVVVLGVPRGELAEPPEVDVSAEAAALSESLGRPVLDPAVPESWRANSARIEGTGGDAWTVAYATGGASGFLRIAQGFDAPETWPVTVLNGAGSSATVTVDGIEWDEYSISDSSGTGNISYALGTVAGTDRILIYGSESPEVTRGAAEAIADSVRVLRGEAS